MQETAGTQVCRWGGEEFLIIMTEQPEREARAVLTGIAEKIRSYPFSYDGYQIRITMTFGLTSGVIGSDFRKPGEAGGSADVSGEAAGKRPDCFIICREVE